MDCNTAIRCPPRNNRRVTDESEALPAIIFLGVDRFLRMRVTMSCSDRPDGKRSSPSGLRSELGVFGGHYGAEGI